MMAPISTFLWAAFGSLAIEILAVFSEIKTKGTSGVSEYYKTTAFWAVRLAVTVIAGALAIAEGANNPMLAINIGASAPAILQLLTKPPS